MATVRINIRLIIKSKVPARTREMVMEADPGQDMVEGHIHSLQSDRTALQVSRLQQLRKRVATLETGLHWYD